MNQPREVIGLPINTTSSVAEVQGVHMKHEAFDWQIKLCTVIQLFDFFYIVTLETD